MITFVYYVLSCYYWQTVVRVLPAYWFGASHTKQSCNTKGKLQILKKCVLNWNLTFQYNLEDLTHRVKINSQLKVKTSGKKCQRSTLSLVKTSHCPLWEAGTFCGKTEKTWDSQCTLGQLIRKEAHSCSVAFQVPSDHLAAIYAYLSRSRLHNDESRFGVCKCLRTTQKWEIQNVCSPLLALSHHFHWLQKKTELGNSTCHLGIFISKISKKPPFHCLRAKPPLWLSFASHFVSYFLKTSNSSAALLSVFWEKRTSWKKKRVLLELHQCWGAAPKQTFNHKCYHLVECIFWLPFPYPSTLTCGRGQSVQLSVIAQADQIKRRLKIKLILSLLLH